MLSRTKFNHFPESFKHLVLLPLTSEISDLERFLSYFNGYQTGVRFLALIGKSEYLHSNQYSIKISRAISDLGRPSLGHWISFLREYSDYNISLLGNKISQPLINFYKNSLDYKFKSPLASDGNKSLSLNDYFVYLRNKWIGHGILPDSKEASERIKFLKEPYIKFLDIYPDLIDFEFLIKENNFKMYNNDLELSIEPLVIQDDYFISYYDGFDGIKLFYIASKSGSTPRVEKEKAKDYKKLILEKEKQGIESLNNLSPILKSLHSANISLNNVLNKLISEGKYLPSIGAPRKLMENEISSFINSNESLFLLSGKTGNGKTFFLSSVAEKYKGSNCILFLRGHELTGENIESKVCEILSTKELIKSISEILYSMEGTENIVLLLIDAINESSEMQKSFLAIINFLANFKFSNRLKVIVTIKDSSIQSLLLEESISKKVDANVFHFNKDDPYFTLLQLTDEEATTILELRRLNGEACPTSNYNDLPSHIKEIIKNPFTLKIFCEIFDKEKVNYGIHLQDILRKYINLRVPKEVIKNVRHLKFLNSLAEKMIFIEKSSMSIEMIYSELGQDFSELEFHESIRILLDNGLITEERIQKRRGFSYLIRFFHDKLRDTVLSDSWLENEIHEREILKNWNQIQNKDLLVGPIEIYFFENIIEFSIEERKEFIYSIINKFTDFPFMGLLEKLTLYENEDFQIKYNNLFIDSLPFIKNDVSLKNLYYSFENALKLLYLQGNLRKTIIEFEKILYVDWKNEKCLWWYLMCTMEVSDYPLSHKALDKILLLPVEEAFTLRCLSMKATLYRKEAKMEDALKYLALCREKIGSEEMSAILWRISYEESYIARARGDYDKSISIYDSMIEFDKKNERQGELATSLNLKALTLSEFSEPQSVIELAQEAIKYAEIAGDQVWIKNCRVLMGKIYLDLKEPILAEPYIREYYQFFDEQNDPMGRGFALYLLGKCEYLKKNHEKVQDILQQSEKDMESIHYAEGLGKLYVLQCEIHHSDKEMFQSFKNKALEELKKFPYFKTESDLRKLESV